MSSMSPAPRLDSTGQVPQERALRHSRASTTSPPSTPNQERNNTPKDDASNPQPSFLEKYPHNDDEDISEIPSAQYISSPDEKWPNEKAKAQQVRIIDLETDPNSSVYNFAKGTTKQGTFSSTKTLVDPSKPTLFKSFTTEKLRLRTSPPDPSNPWGINWYEPSCMLGLFIIGLTGMICHHVYNSWWDGRVVGDPQWIQRFGSVFSFFCQMCMVGAANIAYKQLAWLMVKKRDYTIETLDGMFSICNDPLQYLNFEFLLKATIPAILAGVVWCLPLCAIVSPSTLTSVGGVREKLSTCTQIPTLDFHNENGINENSAFVQGEGMSFFNLDPIDNFTFYYQEPSMDLQKVATLALLSGNTLTLPNPCADGANCTWTFSFDGPSYDCQERDDFDSSTRLTKDMLLPTGTDLYTSVSTGSEDKFGAPTFWETETWQNDSNIGTFLMEPTLWIGFIYNATDPHVIECTLYNTTYNYNMSFTNGNMNINSLQKTLIAPALPSGSSIGPMDPNYEAFAAYHAAGYIFRDTLSLNITQNSSSDFVNTNSDWVFTNSEISQTSLVDPDTSLAVPDFPTQVENQFSNIILSLAAFPSFYSQVNVSGPCTITAAVLEWQYQPFWLVLSYALAAGVTLIAVGIGLYAFRTNGYSADTNFSTFLATTRNPSLDKLSEGCCLGQTPLSKDFMRLKLRFGELEGFNGADDKGIGSGKGEHVAFGLAHETRNIVFGKRYA